MKTKFTLADSVTDKSGTAYAVPLLCLVSVTRSGGENSRQSAARNRVGVLGAVSRNQLDRSRAQHLVTEHLLEVCTNVSGRLISAQRNRTRRGIDRRNKDPGFRHGSF